MKKIFLTFIIIGFGLFGASAFNADLTFNSFTGLNNEFKLKDINTTMTYDSLGLFGEADVFLGEYKKINFGINFAFGFGTAENFSDGKTTYKNSDGSPMVLTIGPAIRYNFNEKLSLLGTIGFSNNSVSFTIDKNYETIDCQINGWHIEACMRYYVSEHFGLSAGLDYSFAGSGELKEGSTTGDISGGTTCSLLLGVTWRVGLGNNWKENI